MDMFVVEEIIRASGLDGLDQVVICVHCSKRGLEILSGETEGMLHRNMGGPENDEAVGGAPFPPFAMGMGVAESPSLEIDVGGHQSLQSILAFPFAQRSRSIRSSEVGFQ